MRYVHYIKYKSGQKGINTRILVFTRFHFVFFRTV